MRETRKLEHLEVQLKTKFFPFGVVLFHPEHSMAILGSKSPAISLEVRILLLPVLVGLALVAGPTYDQS